jgi:hypothetical protein
MSKRIPRLNTAELGSYPLLTADRIRPDDWDSIEKRYGYPLSEEIRTQIAEVTDRLIEFSAFADAAASVPDVLKRVKAIRKDAGLLLKRLCQQDETDRFIERQLRVFMGDAGSLNRVADVVGCLIAACGKVKDDLEATDGLRADQHWNLWVRRVKRIVISNGLPGTVRHDRNGSPNWRPSPFTELIKALQEYLPAYAMRPVGSDEAFSKAINMACHISGN